MWANFSTKLEKVSGRSERDTDSQLSSKGRALLWCFKDCYRVYFEKNPI